MKLGPSPHLPVSHLTCLLHATCSIHQATKKLFNLPFSCCLYILIAGQSDHGSQPKRTQQPAATHQATVAQRIATFWSMQGNCTASAPSEAALGLAGPTLLPLKEGQCLLVTDTDTADIGSRCSVWLRNLYFRVRSTTAYSPLTVLTAHSQAAVWATNVTFHGDASPATQAMHAADARGVYASGAFPQCHIAWFSPWSRLQCRLCCCRGRL